MENSLKLSFSLEFWRSFQGKGCLLSQNCHLWEALGPASWLDCFLEGCTLLQPTKGPTRGATRGRTGLSHRAGSLLSDRRFSVERINEIGPFDLRANREFEFTTAELSYFWRQIRTRNQRSLRFQRANRICRETHIFAWLPPRFGQAPRHHPQD